MPKKNRSAETLIDLQAKGLICAVGGLMVTIIKLPIFGYAFRPFGWVLIVVGIVMFALPSFLAYLKAEAEKAKIGGLSGQPSTNLGGAKRSQEKLGRDKPATGEIGVAFGRERIDPVMDAPPQSRTWNAQVFRDIEWRRFEAVCESLFCMAGFTAKTQSHGADGGVDIWLFSANSQGPAAIVQCKHWRNRPVGVKELREFFGVMSANKIARGTYATSSVFTDDALAFAKANGINAMDGNRLLLQIAQRTPVQQDALLEVAYQGEYWRPTCASCGVKMVERGKPEKRFWGCANYPKCRNTIAKSST